MFEIACRTLLVVIIAGLSSGIVPALFWSVDMDGGLRLAFAGKVISIAVIGSLLIGMPITLLMFAIVRKQLQVRLIHLIAWANLAATMLSIPIAATGGTLGAAMFGVPIFIAANAFAVAGWFLVIKPIRAKDANLT